MESLEDCVYTNIVRQLSEMHWEEGEFLSHGPLVGELGVIGSAPFQVYTGYRQARHTFVPPTSTRKVLTVSDNRLGC